MEKGYGKKEKVAQAVDKSPACVDKCLLPSVPLRTSLTAYPCKDYALQAFWRFCATTRKKMCAILRLLIAPNGAGSARDKERVFGFVPYFSVYLLVENFGGLKKND